MEPTKSMEQYLKDQQVIPAMRQLEDLDLLLNKESITTFFVLNCTIFQLQEILKGAKKRAKQVFVHVDLVEGLGKDPQGVRFLAESMGVGGIITTKTGLIKEAKQLGLLTIQRFFMVDSEAIKAGIRLAKGANPDALEILPAFLPRHYLELLHKELKLPVLAGGLIRTKEEVKGLMNQGFLAVTTSEKSLWTIDRLSPKKR